MSFYLQKRLLDRQKDMHKKIKYRIINKQNGGKDIDKKTDRQIARQSDKKENVEIKTRHGNRPDRQV